MLRFSTVVLKTVSDRCMKKLLLLFLLLAYLITPTVAQKQKAALVNADSSYLLQVSTADGHIAGTMTGSRIRLFRGIPFAAPPVGPLRWKAPQPVKPWSGVRRCTAFRRQPNAKQSCSF
jgi:para-nitrobenzyl esterase